MIELCLLKNCAVLAQPPALTTKTFTIITTLIGNESIFVLSTLVSDAFRALSNGCNMPC